MQAGKFPHHLMESLLGELTIDDPRVVLGPGVGEDAAALDMGDRLLIAKSDPVTMATDRIGWYAVQVNANDVAASGATPRWFLATILAPAGFTEEQGAELFKQVADACQALDVTLVGGHSEVTLGIERPIVMGTMLGEVERDRLVRTGGAQEGDSIVITKGIAIEGTALLARDRANDLRRAGVDESVIESAAGLLDAPGISVLTDARVAGDLGTVHSMHDVTEGGLYTGLREIATASHLGLAIEEDTVPVLPETVEVCRALSLDPMGLLGSGALLITLPAANAPRLLGQLERAGVNGWEIGQMMEAEEGLVLFTRQGEEVALPEFQRDELARYLSMR